MAPERWKRSSDYQAYAGEDGLYRLAEDIAWLQVSENSIVFKNFYANLNSPFLHILARFATGYIDVREITSYEHYRLYFMNGVLVQIRGTVVVTYPEPQVI